MSKSWGFPEFKKTGHEFEGKIYAISYQAVWVEISKKDFAPGIFVNPEELAVELRSNFRCLNNIEVKISNVNFDNRTLYCNLSLGDLLIPSEVHSIDDSKDKSIKLILFSKRAEEYKNLLSSITK